MLKKWRKLRENPRQFFVDWYDKRAPLNLRVRLCIDSTDCEIRGDEVIIHHPVVVDRLRQRLDRGRSRIVIGWW